MEIDPATGLPGFSLSTDLTDDKDVKETILDVFAAIERLGDQVVVAIDEFQKIAEIDDGGWLEATLRTQMQQLPNTTFLFTGSRRSVISDMLNNQTRPFYRLLPDSRVPGIRRRIYRLDYWPFCACASGM